MDAQLRQVELNESAKNGILRQTVMQFPDLARYGIYRGDESYDGLRQSI